MKQQRFYKKAVPMLVYRSINETKIETKEYMAVHAFAHGFATYAHFDKLLELLNLMLVAGQTDKSRKYIREYAELKLKPILQSIKDRHAKTGKLGVNAEELKELRNMLEVNKEFWIKQTGQLYDFCANQVNQYYSEVDKKYAAETTKI